MCIKSNILKTNIKYNSNKNEFNNLFFKNGTNFLYLYDCILEKGYFAIDEKESLEITKDDELIFTELDKFLSLQDEWKFGFLSYDLKNDVEDLSSNNFDGVAFPKLRFFIPKTLIEQTRNGFDLVYGDEKYLEEVKLFSKDSESQKISLESRVDKKNYLEQVKRLQNEINFGNIYEVNFCYEYYKRNVEVNPVALYNALMPYTKAPFSAVGKFNDHYIISASPERFIKKEGKKIVSQPIKGTIKRGENEEEDKKLIEELKNNPKERSENIMIVDLVRNDLSQIGTYESVKVDELCEIYSFESVHQMISTVSCDLKEEVQFSDILKATFPMGSMTGAPKIRAMQLIEEAEETKRGLYSGSVGYVKPNGDFDFNVIIRSFLYNKPDKYLSAMVGGAITALSDPEKEYEETLVKIAPLLKAINS